MDFSLLIPLSPFIMVIAIVFISRYFKSRDQRELQQTFRAAIERGQQLTKEDLEMMRTTFVKPPINDVRTGLILIAVGIGFGIMAYFVSFEEVDAFYPMLGIGSIPALIGLVFLGIGIWRLNAEKRS